MSVGSGNDVAVQFDKVIEQGTSGGAVVVAMFFFFFSIAAKNLHAVAALRNSSNLDLLCGFNKLQEEARKEFHACGCKKRNLQLLVSLHQCICALKKKKKNQNKG